MWVFPWLKVKITSFGRATFSHSAVQPPFDILTFLSHWATLGNQRSGLPGETSGFVCSQHTAPRNIELAQTQSSQCTNSHLGRVEPQRFISCALRNSRKASVGFKPQTDLQANAPRLNSGGYKQTYKRVSNVFNISTYNQWNTMKI